MRCAAVRLATSIFTSHSAETSVDENVDKFMGLIFDLLENNGQVTSGGGKAARARKRRPQ